MKKKSVLWCVSLFLSISIGNAQNNTYTTTTLYTPNGSSIEARVYTDHSQSYLNEMNRVVKIDFPNAEFVSTATMKYNCHAYAWYSPTTTTHRWIQEYKNNGTANLSNYWDDFSYVEVNEANGEIVHYFLGDHSAIRNSNTVYTSKWGDDALMRHAPNYGPVHYFLNSRRYYKKFIISGTDNIACNSSASFSVPTAKYQSSITWSVSGGGLQITSGQGTNNITVSTSNGNSSGGFIQATVVILGVSKTIHKAVIVGAPGITSVSGPSQASVGESVYFNASPIFSSSVGNYEWMVDPNTASQSAWRHTNAITFNTPGTYEVGCRSYSPCVSSGGSYTTTYIYISGYSYNVISGTSKQITIEALNIDNSKKMTDIILYSLYNVASGQMLSKGQMLRVGGTLDFGNVPAGIYLLQIFENNNVIETHRVILK